MSVVPKRPTTVKGGKKKKKKKNALKTLVGGRN